jgi:hypothetical protein
MLLAAAVLVLVPSQQQAVAKGVFFDPESPAGKEYALPLDQARSEAAGKQSDGPAGEKAHLFGEGISGRGSPPGASGPGIGTDRPKAPAEVAASGPGHVSRHLHTAAVTAAAISSADDHYALLGAIIWVAAILALGALAGFALRIAQRPRST